MYGRNRYKRAHAETASPGDLIVMLYDGIIRFISQAENALEDEDNAVAGMAISRSIDIVAYLQAVLRVDVAPQLAASLDTTYTGWSTLLTRANADGDKEAIAEIRAQVADLREAWAQVNEVVKQQGGPAADGTELTTENVKRKVG